MASPNDVAVMVIGYVPMLPMAGVPLNLAPVLVGTKITPVGNAPDAVTVAAVPTSVVIVNDCFFDTTNVAPFDEVMVGGVAV